MESHSICCLAIWSSPGRAAHSIGWDHSQNGRTAGVGSGDAREQISWSTFFFLSGDCTERRGKMGRFMLFSYLVKILKVRKFRTMSHTWIVLISERINVARPKVDAIFFEAKKEDIEKAVGSKREEGREMRSQLNTMKCLGDCRMKLPWVDAVTIPNGHNFYNYRYLYPVT